MSPTPIELVGPHGRIKGGVEQATKTMIEARLQPVAQRHQFFDPGDEAALLFSRHRQGVQ